MPRYAYRLVNVFARTTLAGNPLCVFEDGRGLDTATMQALALQFNLSETTFILPSDKAAARVRVFTPGYEMRFAGHPTLGTAHVLRDMLKTGDALTLEFAAGLVPVTAQGRLFRFKAPAPEKPPVRPVEGGKALMAPLLSLNESDFAGEPIWVNAGADQIMIPLASADAVKRAAPNSARMSEWPLSDLGRKTGYVFAMNGEDKGVQQVISRYFFTTSGGGVSEDPGTGSACANLGGWFIAQNTALPLSASIAQGEQTGRSCHLSLNVDEKGGIFVGGEVIELGRGYVEL